MARARVLVVEDDPVQQELYETLLGQIHKDEFIGLLAKTGKSAREQLKKHPSPPIDAVILDWRLTDEDGLSILRDIRANPATQNLIVFMVTGNTRAKDTEAALQARADDYITKPFREQELCLKLRNHLERWHLALEARDAYSVDGLRVRLEGKNVTLAGHEFHLQPKEFDLLVLFLSRPGIIHPQDYLSDALSTSSDKTSPDQVRRHVHNLRAKLGAWGERIEALYGQGYVLHPKPPISRD